MSDSASTLEQGRLNILALPDRNFQRVKLEFSYQSGLVQCRATGFISIKKKETSKFLNMNMRCLDSC